MPRSSCPWDNSLRAIVIAQKMEGFLESGADGCDWSAGLLHSPSKFDRQDCCTKITVANYHGWIYLFAPPPPFASVWGLRLRWKNASMARKVWSRLCS